MSDEKPTGEMPAKASAKDAVENPARSARPPTPEAQRALAEAAARRAESTVSKGDSPKEIAGRGGLDPTRYGDWEVKGIISDF